MKFRTLIATVLILLPFTTFAQTTSPNNCPILTRTLTRGMRNTEVVALQKYLVSIKLLSNDSATGFYGLLTQRAVQTYQRTQNLEAVGYVGARTRAALRSCSRANAATDVGLPKQSVPPSYGGGGANTPALRECRFNGETVAHGASVIAYEPYSVSLGQTCKSETRFCNDGVLSGSYSSAACAVQIATTCVFGDHVVQSGSSITAYEVGSVSDGKACRSETRSCANGVLSGTYQYGACAVGTGASCDFLGQRYASGKSVTAYRTAIVPTWETCQGVSETRMCTNGVLSGSYVNASCSIQNETSLLWNPGPNYSAGLTLASIASDPNSHSYWGSSLTEAALVGNPSNGCPNGYPGGDGLVAPAPNGACASFYTDTRVGWTAADLNTLPGWSIWNLAGGGGVTLERTYLNNAFGKTDKCTLREIGLVYNFWPNDPNNTQFRSDSDGSPFTLGQFKKVIGKFTSKLNSQDAPTCQANPTQKIEVDFRVQYLSKSGENIRTDVLGVVVGGMNGVGIDGQPQLGDIYWEGTLPNGTRIVELHGTGVGVLAVTTSYQDYQIEFKSLYKRYITPPQGFNADDAVVMGYDVYSSTQGGNISFTLKSADLIGSNI